MPVDKQVQLRYEVLNKCFRDLYRDYTIDDLVDACNKAMLMSSKRAWQSVVLNRWLRSSTDRWAGVHGRRFVVFMIVCLLTL